MAKIGISCRGITGAALVVLFAGTIGLGGCADGPVDVQFDAPILNAVGVNLNKKAKDESDLPERPGIVMPPNTAVLPPPGEGQGVAANQAWPDDADAKKKSEAEAKAAAREKYCREGDWSGKGGIGEYEKATGKQERCPSTLGEAINKTVGGRPADQ